ncbi:MerR family transcriptional regulator [Bifidobacterium sp. LC6]|uniref:MerR family transcriptional regulator n=1 Tax=Bifidobacterium colobi TaxID=2809026 RepID=A0ABS5UTQ2_9BIFI|nr:MerR family transcriptional regulator [Bifidobacterium colobi]MBT1174423.1 MerR family transcriptional regulator [Bifidobacterium colobi]
MSYTIRQVATQFHMQPSTLRCYEDQGLLTNVGRTETGQRVYEDCHIDRLRAICCFKNAGMTIDDLKKFFVYESNEPEHINEILELLESRRKALDEQRCALNEAAIHVQRKLHYYSDIKRSIDAGESLPDWKNYKTRVYSIDC